MAKCRDLICYCRPATLVGSVPGMDGIVLLAGRSVVAAGSALVLTLTLVLTLELHLHVSRASPSGIFIRHPQLRYPSTRLFHQSRLLSATSGYGTYTLLAQYLMTES